MGGDLKHLKMRLPNLKEPQTLLKPSYLDLQSFWEKELNYLAQFQFPYHKPLTPSLKHMVKLCFQFDFDKSNQFSHWGLRPLLPDQIKYAAHDAYILLEIHQVIAEQCEKFKIPFDACIQNFLTTNKQPSIPSGGGGGRKKGKKWGNAVGLGDDDFDVDGGKMVNFGGKMMFIT